MSLSRLRLLSPAATSGTLFLQNSLALVSLCLIPLEPYIYICVRLHSIPCSLYLLDQFSHL